MTNFKVFKQEPGYVGRIKHLKSVLSFLNVRENIFTLIKNKEFALLNCAQVYIFDEIYKKDKHFYSKALDTSLNSEDSIKDLCKACYYGSYTDHDNKEVKTYFFKARFGDYSDKLRNDVFRKLFLLDSELTRYPDIDKELENYTICIDCSGKRNELLEIIKYGYNLEIFLQKNEKIILSGDLLNVARFLDIINFTNNSNIKELVIELSKQINALSYYDFYMYYFAPKEVIFKDDVESQNKYSYDYSSYELKHHHK